MNILNSSVVTNAVATTTSSSQPYEQNKLLVKHDFMRYISNSLFSTPYGSDLFKNESELITNLNGCGGISTVYCEIYQTLCGNAEQPQWGSINIPRRKWIILFR
jgi:hypothetical protein